MKQRSHAIMLIPLQSGGGQTEIVTGVNRAWGRCDQNKQCNSIKSSAGQVVASNDFI